MEDPNQLLRQFELNISEDPLVATFSDYYGNTVGDFSTLQPHQSLVIDSRLTIESYSKVNPAPTDTVVPSDLPQFIGNNICLLRLKEPERIREQWVVENILDKLQPAGKSVAQLIWACNEFIYCNFKYVKGITSVETTIDEILDHRSGVCQDFAHVMLQLMRTLGVPARYVSGYICPNKSGLRGEGATHAWVECWMPDSGWVGIDPTNNVWVNGYHIKLAVGRDFNDCSPVKGTFKGIARQELSVYVSVGYEDGHVFEDVNQVQMEAEPAEGMEPWQTDWMQAQQQQQ